jgi:drug/metabolite transporter (DMT)-like permease
VGGVSGYLLAMFSLVTFSLNIVLVSAAAGALEARRGFVVALGANASCVAVLLAVSAVVLGDPVTWSWSGAAVFAGAGVLTTSIGRRLQVVAIDRIGPSRAGTTGATSPVFALVFGVIALGDRIGPAHLLGVVLTLVGVVMANARAAPPKATLDARPASPDVRLRDPTPPWVRSSPLSAGSVVALVSAASYGVGNVIRAGGVRAWEEPILGTLIGVAVAIGLYSLVTTSPARAIATARAAGQWDGVRLWALSGAMLGLAQTSVVAASGMIPVGIALVIATASPIVVIPLTLLLPRHRRDAVTWQAALGAVATVAGVSILLLAR